MDRGVLFISAVVGYGCKGMAGAASEIRDRRDNGDEGTVDAKT
jgi:hypothetical protein